ncbi:acyl-CoA thioesterase domain-containing protein [Nocardioides daejeonensis]|uniref:acyl-CoA thioesterase domain-containing protein n=1 Tax=Nocardioides daejeonensis TaxID=1046556 RepID=UPI000D7472B0|nr:acyl-CoA thioesterase domain-containing protein [Nocardioides daejeonensis]
MDISFFRREGEQLVPTEVARSLWSAEQMHGVAISGALGLTAEHTILGLGRDDLVPSRHTVDLFRPAAMAPCDLVADVVREGNRLALVDVRLEQEGELMARASVLFLKPTEEPPGQVWKPTDLPVPPPLDVAPPASGPRPPLFHSAEGWSPDFLAHQNAEHKTIWNTVPWIVSGEQPSGFAAAAAVADSTTLVTNWGTAGVNYINADVTLTLARRPVSPEIGLCALDHTSYDGVSVGSALVFDREGPLGTSIVTAVSNAKRTVDFGNAFKRNSKGSDPTTRV